MKKTFRSILAGALALLTVSCYDDTALREQINGLDERVTAIENLLNAEVNGLNDLASRLADAEDALAAANVSLTAAQGSISEILAALDAFDGQVDGLVSQFEKAISDLAKVDSELAQAIAAGDNALATALQEGKTELAQQLAAVLAKVAVVKVEEVGGNVVLTLADGNKVSLSKPLSNVENSGLVTVDENGMWAVVKADGTTQSLNVPFAHPDVKIQFQVAEDGTLQYSVNGGDWASTGVSTSDLSGQTHVINNVQVAEDNSHVTITIGETSFALPLYVAKVVTFELSRESMYVGYGLTKTFTVVSEGVESFYVASKPDGWKVTVEGNVVTVAAPSQKVADLGVAEAEGEIVLHADAESCKYASVKVTTGPAFSLTIDNATGDVTVFNALATEYPDMTGMFGPTYEFGNAMIGILTAEDLSYFSSTEELIQFVQEGNVAGAYLDNLKWNIGIETFYQEGVYEEDVYTLNIADLAAAFWPPIELEEGVSYVVWALPQTDKVLKEQFTLAYYKPLKVQPEATSVTFNEVTIELAAYGATGYFATLVEESMLDPEYGMTLEYYLENGYGYGGVWKEFTTSGSPYMFGQEIVPGEPFALSNLNYYDPLSPNTTYYLVILPYDESKPVEEYDMAKDLLPFVYEFTTTGITAGAPEATLEYNEDESGYKAIAVDVVSPEGCVTYYSFKDPGELDDLDDEALANYLLKYSYYSVEGAETVYEEYLTPGVQEVCKKKQLYAVTLTPDGKYSIATAVFETISLPVVDSISMTLDSITKDENNNVTAVFSVEGADKVVVYPYYNGTEPSAFRINILTSGVACNYYGYYYADVVDGKATVTYTSSNDYLYFSAYNVYEGEVVELVKPGKIQVSASVTK